MLNGTASNLSSTVDASPGMTYHGLTAMSRLPLISKNGKVDALCSAQPGADRFKTIPRSTYNRYSCAQTWEKET